VEELAPRDEVTRAIHDELERTGREAVLLDMRAVEPHRFPNITAALQEAGFDSRRDLIPVAPAAHYMIGGIVSDIDGRSTLPALFSVGECACTGVHGANRLASNSLSECFVFGRRAALAAATNAARGSAPTGAAASVTAGRPAFPSDETRDALWARAGVVRDRVGLEHLSTDPHALARLISQLAIAREESRGCHLRSDFTDTAAALDGGHFVLERGTEARLERWT
jgi:L-aspartate oxidase